MQLVPESPFRLGDVIADRRRRHAERAADFVVGELAVARHHVRASAHGRQRLDGAPLDFLQLGIAQFEVGLHPAVDTAGAVERPVPFAGPTVGVAAPGIAGAGPGPLRGEGAEGLRLTCQGAVVEGDKEFDGDILGDVLGSVVIHEAPGRAARDDEDALEQALVSGDVEGDARLHGGTRRIWWEASRLRGGSTWNPPSYAKCRGRRQASTSHRTAISCRKWPVSSLERQRFLLPPSPGQSASDGGVTCTARCPCCNVGWRSCGPVADLETEARCR
ncbi:MAG TPA: hypothetical protein VFY85_01130 [Gemmatimonadaceae bacterium]|nr:hypothetical protein [Gemmatimonadaceae bacterium]